MPGDNNGSGNVTNRQLYEALLEIQRDFSTQMTNLRVLMAGMPCQSQQTEIAALTVRVEKLEKADHGIPWKRVAVFAGSIAVMLGLDKVWDMFYRWWFAYEQVR